MIRNPATSFPAGCRVFLCLKTLRGFNGWTVLLNRTGTDGMMMLLLTAKQLMLLLSSRIVVVSYTTNERRLTMRYSNYKQCIQHIAELSDFRSNSLHGVTTEWGFLVVSYNTTIAFIKADFSVAALNVQKYSVTTSKQQTYVKQAIARIREAHPNIDVVEVQGWQALAEKIYTDTPWLTGKVNA